MIADNNRHRSPKGVRYSAQKLVPELSLATTVNHRPEVAEMNEILGIKVADGPTLTDRKLGESHDNSVCVNRHEVSNVLSEGIQDRRPIAGVPEAFEVHRTEIMCRSICQRCKSWHSPYRT